MLKNTLHQKKKKKFLSKDNLTMNLNIMSKLFITKGQIIKMMTHNNQILSSKTLCFINECFVFFCCWNGAWGMLFFQSILYAWNLSRMIFNSTCEMQLVAYDNIVM